ncbi:AraC family transcriptional regulator [Variovorax ginsengisoli]|uniref:AraC family transcriptional regulator n=1 Tax=Variovorax ginsengisoli TaxID=363844 RepID=A0ABT8S9I2_9BURK|nr:AraC family transcriptional regulator [Variovorax ginsengisoli]MDN8616404.1 AraC family transcriptional regulator [Variovorax ginsengisoli]MDO1535574.1 AraC family transcriptional regulator [Variovorax ginsengisoli]
MADRLEALLTHFSVTARVFQTGALCGINDVDGEGTTGQLHLVRRGEVGVSHGGAEVLRIRRPSLLLYPRPMAHRFITEAGHGADFACAHLQFEGGAANPILAALPAFVCLPLEEIDGTEGVLELLFEEAFEQRCGKQVLLNRLFDVVLIQVLRHLMEQGQTRSGLLAGLSHPRLRNAVVAMHERPALEWTLDALSAEAGMSRSVFATQFRHTVGCTPGVYLQRWRVGLAQLALRQGRPLKLIAQEVGYGSEAALSRAFKAQSGVSPREWKQAA